MAHQPPARPMTFYPLMKTWLHLWVPHPPRAVQQRLEAALHDKELSGTLSGKTFSVSKTVRNRRNSWRPVASGVLTPWAGGTRIEVSLTTSLMVRAFTIVHACFFLGLTWLMGVAAFSSEVKGTREALTEILGAARCPLADPVTATSMEQYPWSLHPEIALDQVRLTLYQRRWHRQPAPLILQLGPAGITLDPAAPDARQVPWHHLTRARVEGMTLQLGPVELTCTEHPPEHLKWLASHLRAQAGRLAATAEERRSFSRNAHQIAQAHRDRSPS